MLEIFVETALDVQVKPDGPVIHVGIPGVGRASSAGLHALGVCSTIFTFAQPCRSR